MPIWNGQEVDWGTYNFNVNMSGQGNAPRNPDGTLASGPSGPSDSGPSDQPPASSPGPSFTAPAAAPAAGQQRPAPIKDQSTGRVYAVDPATGRWAQVTSPAEYGRFGIAANESNIISVPQVSSALVGAPGNQQITNGQGVVIAQPNPNGPPVGSVNPAQAPPPAAGQQPPAAGGPPGTAGAGLVNGLSPEAYNALTTAMSGAARAAAEQSDRLGYLVEPVFSGDGTGRWTYQPVGGPNAAHIPTVQSGLTKAQIEELAARTALSRITAEGRFKDENGQWVSTPSALRDLAAADLAKAQASASEAERAYTAGARTKLTEAQTKQTQAEADYTAGARTDLTNAQTKLTASQARKEAIDAAYQRGVATGVFIDPDTGQQTTTLAAKKNDADIALSKAQTAYQEAQTVLERARVSGYMDTGQLTEAARAARAAEAVAQANVTGYFTAPGGGTPGQQTLAAQRQQVELALARANATGNFVDPVSGQSVQTLQGRQQQLDEAFRTGMAVGTIGGQQTLAGQQQAFEQQVKQAELASNPRNYVQSAMLGQVRGGLGGQAPTNQATPTTLPGMSQPFTAPGVVHTTGVGGVAPANAPVLGQPGSPDHYATFSTPEGGQLHLYDSPNVNATIPVTAAAMALLTGKKIPTTGGLGINGGYVNRDQLQSVWNPAKQRGGDFARLGRDEQAQIKGLSSAMGYSDNQTEDTLKRTLPGFRAPSGAGAGVGVPSMGGVFGQ